MRYQLIAIAITAGLPAAPLLAMTPDEIAPARAQLFQCQDGYSLAWHNQADGSVVATTETCGKSDAVVFTSRSPSCPHDPKTTALNAALAKRATMDYLALARGFSRDHQLYDGSGAEQPKYAECGPATPGSS